MSEVMKMLLAVVFLIVFGFFSFAHANDSKPAGVVSYEVKNGDMLRLISLKHYGTELKAKYLARINGIKNPDMIIEGSVIKIPSITRKAVSRKIRSTDVYRSEIKIEEVAVSMVKENAEEIKLIQVEKEMIITDLTEKNADVSSEKADIASLIEWKADEQKYQLQAAPSEKTDSASVAIPIAEDKSKWAEEKKEPMSESALEFTALDVMPENAPQAKGAEEYMTRDVEHQILFNGMSSKNKVDDMTGGMLDYMAWINTPSLGENFSLGTGVFASTWEDKISNAKISGFMPGVQLGFKYNRHSDNHLMRMVYGKLMVGKEFQSVSQKISPTLVPTTDPMSKIISMESEEAMPAVDVIPTDDAMDSGSNNEAMEMMPIKTGNNFRLGTMLGAHYQLNPKSTLELMNENWFSLGGKASMEMDPAFSLIGSHVYASGDWSWKSGLGPQYEDWSKTWRLHVVPAEITYKEIVTLGVFSDVYLWKKGEMYSGFNSQDLASIGAVLRFNVGAGMYKGHEIKDKQN